MKQKKIKVEFKRPKKISTHKSSTYDVLKHATKWMEKNINGKQIS